MEKQRQAHLRNPEVVTLQPNRPRLLNCAPHERPQPLLIEEGRAHVRRVAQPGNNARDHLDVVTEVVKNMITIIYGHQTRHDPRYHLLEIRGVGDRVAGAEESRGNCVGGCCAGGAFRTSTPASCDNPVVVANGKIFHWKGRQDLSNLAFLILEVKSWKKEAQILSNLGRRKKRFDAGLDICWMYLDARALAPASRLGRREEILGQKQPHPLL